jgi:hypothetical protein
MRDPVTSTLAATGSASCAIAALMVTAKLPAKIRRTERDNTVSTIMAIPRIDLLAEHAAGVQRCK